MRKCASRGAGLRVARRHRWCREGRHLAEFALDCRPRRLSNGHGHIAAHTRAVLFSIATHAGLATLVGLVAGWAWEASRARRTTRRDERAKKRGAQGKAPRPGPSTSPHSVWWTAIYGQRTTGQRQRDRADRLTFYLKSGKVMAGHLAGVTVGDYPDRDFLLRHDPAFSVTVWDAKGASVILTSTER